MRSATWIALGTLLFALPACGWRTGQVTSTQPISPALPMPPVVPPTGSEFAAFPRVPGERVAHHPNEVEPNWIPNPAPPAPSQTVELPQPTPLNIRQPLPEVSAPPIPPAPLTITPTALDPPLLAAVRDFLAERPDRAIEHLAMLDTPSQELALQLIPVLVKASQTGLEKASPHEVGLMMGELERAGAALAPHGPLSIGKSCFCRSVTNFGRYEPFPDRYAFRPGSLVGLYSEVRNVPSEPSVSETGVAGFVTQLACSLQIVDVNGNPVELMDRESREMKPILHDVKKDFTRSRLQDYFIVFWFPVPSQPGDYRVTFEIRDPATRRSVSQTTPFRVQ